MVNKKGIPKETETIAVKRVARLTDKFLRTKDNIARKRPWWSKELFEALLLGLILSLNFYQVFKFFKFPAPLIKFSGPVIPLLAKGIELFNIPFGNAIQFVYLSFFLLFPLFFYLLINQLSGRKLIALISILIVSLPIYPFSAIRINTMFLGNDGPHIASLAIIPLALWGMIVFLRKGEVKNFILAAVSSSLVMLISPFGFSIFIGLTFITTFSEMLLGRVRLKLSRLFFVLIATFGIVSFWYNPQFSFSLVFGPLGKELRTTIGQLIPISLFAIPVLASFGYLLFDRKPQLQPLFLATFFTIAFTLITMIGGGLFPSHPSRYAPELGMSLSFLIGTGVIGVIDYLKFHKIKKFKFLNTKIFTNSILAGVIVISIVTILVKGGPNAFSSNVLGLWTGVERGTIWRAREEVGKTSSVSGYLITGITTLSLVATGIKYKKGI